MDENPFVNFIRFLTSRYHAAEQLLTSSSPDEFQGRTIYFYTVMRDWQGTHALYTHHARQYFARSASFRGVISTAEFEAALTEVHNAVAQFEQVIRKEDYPLHPSWDSNVPNPPLTESRYKQLLEIVRPAFAACVPTYERTLALLQRLGSYCSDIKPTRHVSMAELSAITQDSLQKGLATFDYISIAGLDDVSVTGLSSKLIRGDCPTLCPAANPVIPVSLLPRALAAYRRLFQLPPGTTIHWVGSDTGYRNRCCCHPDAPYVAPFDQHRWACVACDDTSEPLPEITTCLHPETIPEPVPERIRESVPTPLPDGPINGNAIRWQGTVYKLKKTGQTYKLLNCLWDKASVSFDLIFNEVWDDGFVEIGTLHKAMTTLRNALPDNFPLRLDWVVDSSARVIRRKDD